MNVLNYHDTHCCSLVWLFTVEFVGVCKVLLCFKCYYVAMFIRFIAINLFYFFCSVCFVIRAARQNFAFLTSIYFRINWTSLQFAFQQKKKNRKIHFETCENTNKCWMWVDSYAEFTTKQLTVHDQLCWLAGYAAEEKK